MAGNALPAYADLTLALRQDGEAGGLTILLFTRR